jgi:anaerobic ribonucleoside-triphosphate reductase activating protein
VSTLKIGGLTPFTSIDFPGKLAAVVFVQGCPWRCHYCHNLHLQPREAGTRHIEPWCDVRAWLTRRRGLIDAVVFSGGEPTMDEGLDRAVRDVVELGLEVGLHTAGIYPRRLAQVLPRVTWVGFDVKAPVGDAGAYRRVVGVGQGVRVVEESLSAVLDSQAKLECRTTAHPAFMPEGELLDLAAGLAGRGVRNYVLQIARPVGKGPRAYSPAPCTYPSKSTLATLSGLFESFSVRRE